jgi:hypothetical protein
MEKRILTDDVRKALISKVPFSQSALIDYTPPTYLIREKDSEGKDGEYLIPEEYRPVFKLRSFSKTEMDGIKKNITASKAPDEKYIRDITSKVVMGWTNLYDAGTMEDLEYKADITGGCDKVLWDLMPLQIVSEVLTYVSQISGLLPTERVGL